MAVLVPSMIEIREDGKAMVAGTGFKVRMIAVDHVQRGWSAVEIAGAHQGLSVSQVHSALAHYFEHKADFDAEIEEGDRLAKEGWEAQQREGTPARYKLKALGLL